ncbi:MAG: helix-turn-helix transcriptional regulator [Akkermansiaceae bacterium]|nr:helix-turn-helix transcriptional regulator [Akkermansiaceae bacterium]
MNKPVTDSSVLRVTSCILTDCENRILPLSEDAAQCDALALSLKIQKCERWNELAELTVQGIASLFDAVDVRWLEMTADGKTSLWTCSSSEQYAGFLEENLESIITRSSEMGDFSVKVGAFLHAEEAEVYSLSDFLSASELANNDYVQTFLEPLGVDDILCLQLYFSHGGTVILSLSMPKREILSSEIRSLKFLQSHIRMACYKLAKLASFSNLTSALNELRQQGQSVGISVISRDGNKLWETDDTSRDILRELGGGEDDNGNIQMPAELASWVKLTLDANTRLCAESAEYKKVLQLNKGRDIDVRLLLERAGSGALLVLKRSKATGDYGGMFTRRELDVIRCICEGMSSQVVSEKLSISKRTVDKHLENVYAKLGVSNRLAAVMRLQGL